MATKLSKALTAEPAIVILGLIGGASGHAQVATDGTVGPRVELGGPEFDIGAELGRQAGRNLFHSFERFSLSAGESATFSGPDRIQNVISRVTGGERSDIDGTLRSEIAGADFYFINPAGVLFGPEASLDVTGSFHVSTADELRFRDGARFSADLDTRGSFTFAAPEAFGFLGAEPGALTLDHSHLEVGVGKTLSLVGGDIEINGPGALVEGGRVEVTALAAPGEVRAADSSPTTAAGGIVTLSSLAQISASAVAIFGGQVLIEGLASVGSGGSGGVEILAGEAALDRGFIVSAGSPIVITADRLVLRNGSGVISSAFAALGTSAGDGGDVTLSVGSARIVGRSMITTAVAGMHRSGDMTLTATEKTIVADSILTVGASGTATGGLLTITAPRVEVAEVGAIDASSVDGPAGEIDLEIRELVVSGGGAIRASATGAGAAGDVMIDAEDTMTVTGTPLTPIGRLPSSVTAFSATGPAGRVTIDARRLEVSDGALIGVPSDDPSSSGQSGVITIDVGTLAVNGAAAISATSFGADAGAVIVNATDRVVISDQGRLGSAAGGIGPGGRIEITAPTLVVDGGLITARSTGAGEAGAIRIEVRDRLIVDEGTISTDSATAGGGEIGLHVGNLIDLHDSEITTSIQGGDDQTAGNILIDPKALVIDNSRIQANAPVGFGGRVTIVADNILVPGGDFEALLAREDISATGGDPSRAGSVVVDAPEINLAGDLVILQVPLLDAAALLGEPCGMRRDVGASSFIAAGRGGLPAGPNAPLPSTYRSAQASDDAGQGSAASFPGAQHDMLVLAGCARTP